MAVTGASGQLGRQLVASLARSKNEVLALERPAFDITRAADLARMAQWRPDIVINSAAWTDVDGCARDPARAMAINSDAAGAVAAAAARSDALSVQISTNEVFDGTLGRPYAEDDAPSPINAYGASKLGGERAVANANPRHLIVRTAWLFGPGGVNFVTKILAAGEKSRDAGEPLRVVADEWGNPTWTPELAEAVTQAAAGGFAELGGRRVVHLAGTPPASRLEWATVVVEAAGMGVALVPISRAEFARASSPPAAAVLDTSFAARAGIGPFDWRGPSGAYARVVMGGSRTGGSRAAVSESK